MENITNNERILSLKWWRDKSRDEQLEILRKSNLIGASERLPQWLTGSEIQKLFNNFK